MDYTVKNGRIYTENGLPYEPRWFCDGRLALKFENGSINQVDFFGPETSGNYIVFYKRFWDGMRLFIKDNGHRTALKPKKCEVMPFGFSSQSESADFGIYIADGSIFMRVTPKIKGNIELEFYDDTVFSPEIGDNINIGLGGIERKWSEFELKDNELYSYFEENGVKTYVVFSSDAKLSYRKTPKNTKNVLTLGDLTVGTQYTLCLNISNGRAEGFKDGVEVIAKQFERYDAVAKKAPVLKSEHPLLNQFFELAPMYHESLKTTDVKGAMRAQTTHYWVWGWDTMTSNNAPLYWGDNEFIGDMLDCFEKYSSPDFGIAHAFSRDMTASHTNGAPPPAQGMYITILDLLRLSGGNYKKHYPFAKRLVETIFASEAENTGFCKGTSLYPDFRELIKETGNDISTFNNTVSYCAIRSMQKISESYGDTKMSEKCKAFADKMSENFEDIMYNEKIGFIDSSVDANTYEKRNVPSNNAVKWENNYCGDLVEKRAEQYLKFYEKNLVSPAGLRPLPEWSDCYDADANQLHCWWPVMSEFYTRLINKFDRNDLTEQYVSWVEYWSERLMCPEGIPCYDNDANVPFDNWNCLCGIWHGYSIRGFYNSIVHSFVGIDFDEKGLNIYPYSGEEVEIDNLHFGESNFDIRIKGSGKRVISAVFNGRDLGSVLTIGYNNFKECNTLEIIRG